MKYRKFQGTLISWRALFADAARFATKLGPARVHCISHSASDGRGIVNVWYREGASKSTDELSTELVLKFAHKRGTMISWDGLFQWVLGEAARLHPDQVVSISHSDSKGDGIVTLWYWGAPGSD